MTDLQYEVTAPDHISFRYFYQDPLENLQLRITVKKVPSQLRKILGPTVRKDVEEENRKEEEKQEIPRKVEADVKAEVVVDKEVVAQKMFQWQMKEFSPREILTYSHTQFRPHTAIEDRYREIVREKVKSHMHHVLSTSTIIEEKKSLISELAERKAVSDNLESIGTSLSQLSYDPAKMEEFSRQLVQSVGKYHLCSKVTEDGYLGLINKPMTTSEKRDLNPVARSVLESSKTSKSKSFHILFSALFALGDSDLKALSVIKQIGKEVILVRVVENEDKKSFTISPNLSTKDVGVFGTGHRFKLRQVASKSLLASYLETKTAPDIDFEYWVENIAAPNEMKLTPYEEYLEKENLFREQIRKVGFFERAPEINVVRMIYNIEIIRAYGFEADSLYVAYEISLDPTMTLISASGGISFKSSGNYGMKVLSATDQRHALSSVTQISHPLLQSSISNAAHVSYGDDLRVCMFCFPIEIECLVKAPEEGFVSMPKLYIQVLNSDIWERTTPVGYGFTILSEKPGCHSETISTWRPKGDVFAERSRFFLGGTPMLSDIKLSGIPADLQGSFFNRYGFDTENAGSVDIRYNAIHFQSPYLRKKDKK